MDAHDRLDTSVGVQEADDDCLPAVRGGQVEEQEHEHLEE